MRAQQVVGVGPLTADALVASIGNGHEFANGRQLAAWLGLTPMQHSSGGKARLGGISCRGDNYLRTLLIQGARSCLQQAKLANPQTATAEQIWIKSLASRLPFGKVLVAIANKHARQLWAMLRRGEDYAVRPGCIIRWCSGHPKRPSQPEFYPYPPYHRSGFNADSDTGNKRSDRFDASLTNKLAPLHAKADPLALAKPLDERGLGVRFYPGPVWMHQTHKTVYGNAVWQYLKPVASIESTAAKIRQTQSLKTKGKVSVLPELTGSSLRNC